jgi:hypothetical protein
MVVRRLAIPGVAAVVTFVAVLWAVLQMDPVLDRMSVAWLPFLYGPSALVGLGLVAAVPAFLVVWLVNSYRTKTPSVPTTPGQQHQ